MASPGDAAARGIERAVAEWAVPTGRAAMVFHAKAMAHRTRRLVADLVSGPRRWGKSDRCRDWTALAQHRTRLYCDERPEESSYELGKIQNLRRATALLDRVVIPAGEVFSFWKQIGRASRRRGFATGRMLQQGCLVPSTGGGLCQLSNALYSVALDAGCEIVERHAHSRIVASSASASGQDATVAWNYVDLRFRSTAPMQIEARLSRDDLIIGLRGPAAARSPAVVRDIAPAPRAVARSCATCGETSCFRHEAVHAHSPNTGRTAYLVDENWPEFQDYILQIHRVDDVFGRPLDGARWRLRRYDWPVGRFARYGSSPLAAVARAVSVRRAPAQGAARREAELAGTERIAVRLSRLLSPDVTRICVAQSLLPFLWCGGHLGGREVEVLATRLPISELHCRLDRALAAHSERATLGDFRAPRIWPKPRTRRFRMRSASSRRIPKSLVCSLRRHNCSIGNCRRSARSRVACARAVSPFPARRSPARALMRCGRQRKRSAWRSFPSGLISRGRVSGTASRSKGAIRKPTGSAISLRSCSRRSSRSDLAIYSPQWRQGCRLSRPPPAGF